ncbi:MAG: RNA-binding domain-containing protein [Candidatus Woesearchaeota archaeon]|jgi:RNA binding exosome subunit
MGKNLYRIKVRVFYLPDEDISTNYAVLFPFTTEDFEDIEISEKESEGLMIKETIITKNRHLNVFFKNLLLILNEDKQIILSELNERIDKEHFDFYLRLDKNTLKLTTTGNCFHIKITVAAFPKTFEKVKEKMIELLK